MPDWNSETAEWYAQKYGNYPTNELGVDALELADNLTIVDIGCGTGSALRHAASTTTGSKFIGVDPVPRMIEIAEEQTGQHPARQQIEFRLGSAEEIPVEDESADYVLAFDSVDHWQDIEEGLSEVKRILRRKGLLAITKDKSVPGAEPALDRFLAKLQAAGGRVIVRKVISKQSISFHFLVVEFAKQP